MIKIVCKTIEIGAQFSSAGFGGIDRISSRHSGLGPSIRHGLLDRSQWVVIRRFRQTVASVWVGADDLRSVVDHRGIRSLSAHAIG